MNTNIKCPQCDKSYYMPKYCTTTSMYFPPIYKDGININPDGNITTYYCQCCNCGYEFTYATRYGELYIHD